MGLGKAPLSARSITVLKFWDPMRPSTLIARD